MRVPLRNKIDRHVRGSAARLLETAPSLGRGSNLPSPNRLANQNGIPYRKQAQRSGKKKNVFVFLLILSMADLACFICSL